MNTRLKTVPLSKAWMPIAIVSTILAIISGLIGTISPLRDLQFSFDKFLNANGNGFFDFVAALASDIYSPKFAVAIAIVIVLGIWLVGKSKLNALVFGAIVLSGWLPAEIFKLLFNEPRPNQSALNHLVVGREVDASFPSGHVCFALSIGYGVFLLLRHTRYSKLVVALWLVSICVMGWARLYVGVHYINDEVGALFTSVLGITVFSAIWNLRLSKLVSAWTQRK